jgi:hypothetical protein
MIFSENRYPLFGITHLAADEPLINYARSDKQGEPGRHDDRGHKPDAHIMFPPKSTQVHVPSLALLRPKHDRLLDETLLNLMQCVLDR